jgi:hypothetical protein
MPTPEELKGWAKGAETVVAETVSGFYQRISRHSFSILMLTDNPHVTEPVKKIDQAMTTQQQHIRELIALLGKANTPTNILALVAKMVQAVATAPQAEIVLAAERTRLKDYCLQNLPLSEG